MKLFLNFILFQAGWLTTVIGAANGWPELGVVAAGVAIIAHLWLAADYGRELALLMLAGVIGALFDSALVQTGWLIYPNGFILPDTAPYWIVCLWLLFATTLNVSMRWLRGRVAIAMLFGAIGGPMSYLAGTRLGALEFTETAPALISLGIGWAVMTPVLVWLASRLDGIQPQVALDETPGSRRAGQAQGA